MSTPDPASRWAMPVRKWRRPTARDVVSSLLSTTVVAGAALLVAGDVLALVIVSGSALFGFVSNRYVSDPTHDDEPDEGPLQRSSRELRRSLVRLALGAGAWIVVALAMTACFNHLWPESATLRSWGLGLTLAGTVATLLFVGVPGVRKLRVHD